jgi:WD40 repeat protein
MKRIFPWRYWMMLLLIIGLLGLACNLPVGGNVEPQGEDAQATLAAVMTQATDLFATQEATALPHIPELSPSPQADPQEPAAYYRGFFTLLNGKFIAFDFEGNELGIEYPSGMTTWYGGNETSILADSIYYTEYNDTFRVYRVDSNGAQTLDFIDSVDPVSIAVSADGQFIAWGTATWIDNAPQTELYIANIDGTNIRKVDEILAAEQVNAWLIFQPLKWTEDDKLLYATGMTGIGGYLIFAGYNGLRLYDPQSDSIQVLVNDEEMLGLCLSGVSADNSKVALVCSNSNLGVRVRDLSTGIETAYALLPDQNTAGTVRFSPSGNWLAYVIQRMNPDDEFGQVVVTPLNASSAPSVLAQVEKGTFNVEGWLDEESFLVTRYDENGSGTVWRVNRSDSQVTKLAEGAFVGFLP